MPSSKQVKALLSKVGACALSLLSFLKKSAPDIVAITVIITSLGIIMAKTPYLQNIYLRFHVGSKVYMIKSKAGGGGTGFAVKAPSGHSYILTNDHVCQHARDKDDGTVQVESQDGSVMSRRIITSADFTDLCLIEGLPGVEGLPIAGEPNIGDIVTVVGHPRLRPLTLMSGELTGSKDVEILDFVMKGDPFLDLLTGAKDGDCKLPKNKIEEADLGMFGLGKLKICMIVIKDAYMSSAVVHPGNSGSPVVDWRGRVVAVVFATDSTTWGYMVSNKDLKIMLAHY